MANVTVENHTPNHSHFVSCCKLHLVGLVDGNVRVDACVRMTGRGGLRVQISEREGSEIGSQWIRKVSRFKYADLGRAISFTETEFASVCARLSN